MQSSVVEAGLNNHSEQSSTFSPPRFLKRQTPGSVVFLDFSEVDFDQLQTLAPPALPEPFWERVLNVALDDLFSLVAPARVVVC